MAEKLKSAEQPQKGSMKDTAEKLASKKEIRPHEVDKNDDKVRKLE